MPLRAPGTLAAERPRRLVPEPLLFALLFSIVWLLHAPLLRLPYFWDEAGYFVPAARDLLLTGNPIPTSTWSNAHPPLVMAWLAFWWRFSAFTPAVTRTAMLLVTAFALLGVFRLARQVSNTEVAAAATVLTMLCPVVFAQSSLAHLDMAAAAFTMWGLASYVAGHRGRAIAWFAVAGLAKETALLAPVALAVWEFVAPAYPPAGPARTRRNALVLILSALPLAAWLAYHWARTGVVFGNPEYFRYNVSATLNPLRIAVAFAERIWQLLGYLNMFVLTGAAALAMWYVKSPQAEESGVPREPADADLERSDGEAEGSGSLGWQRPRIATPVQLVFGVVILAYLAALAVVGGAVLARYLLPAYPLVIILCVSTLWRRLLWWRAAVAIVALGFVIGLFVEPPYRIAPEDNLTYADCVRLHKDAAAKLAALPDARVLTAWPATDELREPYLGYVHRPVTVVPVEGFTPAQLAAAAHANAGWNYALVFSTKYESRYRPQALEGWWDRTQVRWFGFHHDLDPQSAAGILDSNVIYEARRGEEWVAILERK